MNKKLAFKLKALPDSPGVYFHKSASGEVIYVGKAAVLKNRVQQYFQSKRDMDAKTLALVAEIADVDWIETNSEIDALFLESEMVKRYKPRFNIDLRDDKSKIYVRINMKDEIPFISFTRQPFSDGAEYFGPFYVAHTVKKALRSLRKVFPYYDNDNPIMPKGPTLRQKSKLSYQMGLTPGVVEGEMTPAEYRKSLRQLISYIKGNRMAVMREIEKNMKIAAKNEQFELAAHYRNQLLNLRVLQNQTIFGHEEFLNASKDEGLAGLKDLLSLPSIPRRIEAFDVSHHGGTHNVASMIVFTNGMPDKTQYRKFKLRAVGHNDLAGMREAIARRLKHLKDWGRPDLIVIDGGKTQLSAVADLLDEAKIPFVGRDKSGDHGKNADVTLVIPAHTRSDLIRGGFDTAASQVGPVMNTHVSKLIARLDEEAHRFAVSYHTSLKRTAATKNALEEIPGIGPVTRKKLIRHFGSLTAVKKATKAELAKVIGPAKAKLVK